MRRVYLYLAMGLLCAALAGCGGGGGSAAPPPANLVNLTGTETLSNDDPHFSGSNRYYQMREITATKDGIMVVMMVRFGSGLNDPYLIIAKGSGLDSPVLTTNDDYVGSKDAKIIFTATRGQVYTIIFTTSGARDFGSYYYLIQEVGS